MMKLDLIQIKLSNYENFQQYRDYCIFLHYAYELSNEEKYKCYLLEELQKLPSNWENVSAFYGRLPIDYLSYVYLNDYHIKWSAYDKFVNNNIKKLLSDEFNIRIYDLFNGLVGVGYFLLSFSFYSNEAKILSTKIIDAFISLSQNDFIIKNKNIYNENIKKECKNGYVDLGISHGLSSIILYLKQCKKQFNSKKLNIAIYNFQNYLLNAVLYYEGHYYISGILPIEKDMNKIISQFDKWSYGTIGSFMALIDRNCEKNIQLMYVDIINHINQTFQNFTNYNLINGLAGVLNILRYYNQYIPIAEFINIQSVKNKLLYLLDHVDINNISNFSIVDGYLSGYISLIADFKTIKHNIFFELFLFC